MRKIIIFIIPFLFNLSQASLKNNAIKISMAGQCHFMIDSQTGDCGIPCGGNADVDYP